MASTCKGEVGDPANDKATDTQEHNGSFPEVEWKFPFNLGFGLGDIFHHWMFGGTRKHKSHKTSSSTPTTPKKAVVESKRSSMIDIPTGEQIELAMFTKAQDDSALWRLMQHKLGPSSGHLFLTHLPIRLPDSRVRESGGYYEGERHHRWIGDCSGDSDEDGRLVCTRGCGGRKEFAFECGIRATRPMIVWEEVPEGHTGAGHNFQPREMDHPTWCDRCGDLVWGLATTHYLRCRNCNFTCHQGCRQAVTLDCESLEQRSPSDACCSHPDLASLLPPEGHQVQVEEVTEAHLEAEIQEVPPSPEEEESKSEDVEPEGRNLAVRIQYYNSHAAHGLEMTLEADGTTFRGFIRVHLNLTRPINVVAGTRPPSIYDILKEDDTLEKKTLTTFYLPRDTVRALHVTSETTAQEVIRSLLKKFKVVDNPRKFALYERYYDHGETTKVKMRLIADNERPLILALLWGCEQNCNKRFVLQENETGDILWEAFTLPELNNFLKILDREEEEYKRQVRQKYKLMELKIREAMERLCPAQGDEAASQDLVTLRPKGAAVAACYPQRESSVDEDDSDGTLKSLAT